MPAGVTASLCSTLLFVGAFVFVSAGEKIMSAVTGHNVTLPCQASNIKAVNWTRADLRTYNVLLYRDGHFVPDDQHPSFKNRVDLQDRQMKDGDVSLILNHVTTADSGTYKCRAFTEKWELIISIDLIVLANEKIVTAVSGQDVSLPCQHPNNKVTGVKWKRADLDSKYILVYQNKQLIQDVQHPSFRNRVDLQDTDMKDGDTTLILKNVKINDDGKYVCLVYMEETHTWDPSIIIIDLIVFPDETIITVNPGVNVTLPCQHPNNTVICVQWTRADLGHKNVFWYQEGQFDPQNQHPSFKNRVGLLDRQMKDGDVSLILKDVTIRDEGKYMCHVLMRETHSWDDSIIDLIVVPPAQTGRHTEDGSVGLKVGLPIFLVLVAVGIGFWIYRKCRQQNREANQNRDERQQDQGIL